MGPPELFVVLLGGMGGVLASQLIGVMRERARGRRVAATAQVERERHEWERVWKEVNDLRREVAGLNGAISLLAGTVKRGWVDDKLQVDRDPRSPGSPP